MVTLGKIPWIVLPFFLFWGRIKVGDMESTYKKMKLFCRPGKVKCWDPGFKFQVSVPHMGYSMLLKTNPQLGKRCVCLAVLHHNSGKSMITPIYLNSGSGCRIEGGTCA